MYCVYTCVFSVVCILSGCILCGVFLCVACVLYVVCVVCVHALRCAWSVVCSHVCAIRIICGLGAIYCTVVYTCMCAVCTLCFCAHVCVCCTCVCVCVSMCISAFSSKSASYLGIRSLSKEPPSPQHQHFPTFHCNPLPELRPCPPLPESMGERDLLRTEVRVDGPLPENTVFSLSMQPWHSVAWKKGEEQKVGDQQFLLP